MNDLFELNYRGFLPRENEDEATFFHRIAQYERAKSNYYSDAVLSLCDTLFDAKPDWVPIIEEQKGLAPWQGAALWVQEDDAPSIQVSPRLNAKGLKKWYPKEEVIAHELIHAIRLPLNASRFEEMIAYKTSANPIRRYLGGLIRHPYEVYILLASLVLSWTGIFWNALFTALPLLVLLGAFVRLVYTHSVFKKCEKKLAALLKDKSKAFALIVRLTDREIALFARLSSQDIHSYIANNKQLRWKMLSAVYIQKASGEDQS